MIHQRPVTVHHLDAPQPVTARGTFGGQWNPFRWSGLCLLLLALICVSLSSSSAWGRAGGGENFGGGGGGGGGGFGGGFSGGGGFPSGGYSGGGGGGGGIPLPPEIAIPLIIIIILIIIFSSQQAQQQHVTRTIRRGRQRQSERELEEAVRAIQQHDPEFSIAAFLERAKTAFGKIQAAWSEQSLQTARPFVSDGIFERFSLQIGMLQANGIRNVVDQVRVEAAGVSAIFSNSQFDTIHVRIRANAADYNEEIKTGRRIAGSENSGAFSEYWSFCRRPGAKSLNAGGAIEGQCPRCGAVLKIVDRAKCNSCGAQVNSGEYDWVLAEITQESEWQVPTTEKQLPGLSEIAARDPGFSLQHIEDRVSVMYWRLRAAEFYRDIKYAAPVVTSEYRAELNKSMSSNARYWKDPAVGQVEFINARTNPETGMDELNVMVRWSGTLLDKASGREVTLRERTIYTQLFKLIRGSNVTSQPAGTFTSAGCANCGAPLSVNESGACLFCGASLTTGQFDWVLTAVERYTPEAAHTHALDLTEARTQTTRVVPETGTELPLAILAKVMLIDGQLDDRELRALQKLAARRNMTSQQLDSLLQQARVEEISIPIPSNEHQARSYMTQLIQAVLTDGRLSREETQLINHYAQQVGLPVGVVREIIQQETNRAYSAAKNELRRS